MSSNFFAIINVKPSASFRASRGLRQGNLLSPFYFILVVDVWGRLMDRAKDADLVEGFENGRDKISIPHLQFANNSLFFLLGMRRRF